MKSNPIRQQNIQQFGWDQVMDGYTFILQLLNIEKQSKKFGFVMQFTVLCKEELITEKRMFH